jgi:poly-beta-1,6-N-acetyl-D-glucosamine biosynthesis protein PgaD
MKDPFADWPPIIRSAKRSRLILWRDALLTALMWFILFLILYTELAFVISALLVLLGRSDAVIDAELTLFFRRMRPLLLLIAGLVVMLVLATLVSMRRRNRALATPQPAPLSVAEVAAIAGMTPADLAAAQALKIAVVGREGTGLRVIDDAR